MKASPTLNTAVSPSSITIGQSATDTATVAAGFGPTGTLTFRVYGPNNSTCSGAAVSTTTKSVAGNANYPSAPFTPTAVGLYRFVVSYGGDANNNATTSVCNAAGETLTVKPFPTTVVTHASSSVPVGGVISDSATLSGGSAPTGAIVFKVFGPNNATCAGAAAFSSTQRVGGNGTYSSGGFTTTAAGTYRWTAAYSGDATNAASSSPCNAANESVTVGQLGPTITTNAAPSSAFVGNTINDVAHLTGGFNPTGTITFRLYGPDDPTCSGAAISTSTRTVAGNGDYLSAGAVPTTSGTFVWVATYSGDANNRAAVEPVGSSGPQSPCSNRSEMVTVQPAGN